MGKAEGPSELTLIRVHFNVGMGNRITDRGDSAPFGWDCGIDAQNEATDLSEFRSSSNRIPPERPSSSSL